VRAIELEQVRRPAPEVGPQSMKVGLVLPFFDSPDPGDLKRYRDECPAYLERYGRFLEEAHFYPYRAERTYQLRLAISNVRGRAPAEDLDLWLFFPTGIQVHRPQDRQAGRAPREPERPSPPLTFRDKLKQVGFAHPGSPLGQYIIGREPTPPAAPSDWGPRIDYDKRRITYHVAKVKHGMTVSLKPVNITFPLDWDRRVLDLPFQVSCGNPGDPLTGDVTISLELD
jgi:hypothetical protein